MATLVTKGVWFLRRHGYQLFRFRTLVDGSGIAPGRPITPLIIGTFRQPFPFPTPFLWLLRNFKPTRRQPARRSLSSSLLLSIRFARNGSPVLSNEDYQPALILNARISNFNSACWDKFGNKLGFPLQQQINLTISKNKTIHQHVKYKYICNIFVHL